MSVCELNNHNTLDFIGQSEYVPGPVEETHPVPPCEGGGSE
jgi:hypothetical protein